MKNYYTLFIRNYKKGDRDYSWSPEFGSYLRIDCVSEMRDHLDHGHLKRNLKIVKHFDTKESLIVETEKLNKKEAS